MEGNFFKDLYYKLRDKEMEDIFPLNRNYYDVKDVLKSCGIYLGALVILALFWIFLGGIFILGFVVKLVCVVVGAYALIGMVALALQFMKVN